MSQADWNKFFDRFSECVNEDNFTNTLIVSAENILINSDKERSELANWLIQQIHVFRRANFYPMRLKGIKKDGNIITANNAFVGKKYEIKAALLTSEEREAKAYLDTVESNGEAYARPEGYHRVISDELSKELEDAKRFGVVGKHDPMEHISSFIELNFNSKLPALNPKHESENFHHGLLQVIMLLSNRLACCNEASNEQVEAAYITNLWGQSKKGLFRWDYQLDSDIPSMALDINKCIDVWWQRITYLASNKDFFHDSLMTYPFLVGVTTKYLRERDLGFSINFEEDLLEKYISFIDNHASNLKVALTVLSAIGDAYFNQPLWEGMHNASRLVPSLGDALNKCDAHYRKYYGNKSYLCPIHVCGILELEINKVDASIFNHLGMSLYELLKDHEVWGDPFHKTPLNSFIWNSLCLKTIELARSDGHDDLAESLFFLMMVRNLNKFKSLEPWAGIWEAGKQVAKLSLPDLKEDITYALSVSQQVGNEKGVQGFILSRYEKLAQLLGCFGTGSLKQATPSNLMGYFDRSYINELLKQGEGRNVEFKSSLKWSYKADRADKELVVPCVKAIAAFLNSSGGILLIGVDDHQSILGIEKDLQFVNHKNQDGFKLLLQGAINRRLGNLAGEYILFHMIPYSAGVTICAVQCHASQFPIYFNDSSKEEKLYIRQDARITSLITSEVFPYISKRFDK